jgi:hypothetical protein
LARFRGRSFSTSVRGSISEDFGLAGLFFLAFVSLASVLVAVAFVLVAAEALVLFGRA